jgi:amidase
MDVTMLSASEQSRLVRQGKLSARELLEAVVERCSGLNGPVNAVITTRLDEAVERADRLDGVPLDDRRAALFAVPMTVKEAFDVTGTVTTWGESRYRKHYPSRSAAAVERLERAGAIVYGKTNVATRLADWQTCNEVYGATNNPWDLRRTPGGSSGGSAVSVALGFSAVELGSDVGGSIRNPAHYCGVYGHKPTFGIVSMAGHSYPGNPLTLDIEAAGPLARSASDLELALRCLAEWPMATQSATPVQSLSRWRTLADFKVGVMLSSPCAVQAVDLTDRLTEFVGQLSDVGVQIAQACPAVDQERSFDLFQLLVRAGTEARAPRRTTEEYAAAAARHASGDRSYLSIVGTAATLSHAQWLKLNEERSELQRRWSEFFTEFDLLLCPAAASVAFKQDYSEPREARTITINGRAESVLDQLFWAGWSGCVHLPSTVIPVGLTSSGLPCGMQVVGPLYGDFLTIRFAELIEREIGSGFSPPMNRYAIADP